ncbi:MAG: DNA internalization-related competence protein ComEC/Rec2 [Gammaproteobacteria bacterium]
MIILAISFVAGVLALHLQATLPGMAVQLLAVAALPGLAARSLRPLAVGALGFLWAACHVQALSAQAIPERLLGQTVLLEGIVADRPSTRVERRTRFLLQAVQLDDGSGWQPFDVRVRLDWYSEHPVVAAGERWQLAVRLKPPAGYANAGGFDHELWLFCQRIRGIGYVRSDVRNRRIDAGHTASLTRFRNRLATSIETQAGGLPSMALVQALTIGERSRISSDQWRVLRVTGTSHLMAISGLHISLVAGLVFWCMQFAWSRSCALTTRLPAVRAAAIAALLAALLYALLSGFAIPAQRALVMVSVLMFAVMSGHRVSFSSVIGVAAVVTLLLDPLALLSAGWWLSFWAVCAIAWFVVGREGLRLRRQHWLFMPVALAVCMAPLLLMFFQQVSLVAPLANIVAVPWVSFLVVPLALAGSLLYGLNEVAGLALMQVSARLLDLLWYGLDWLAACESCLLDWPQPAPWILVMTSAGVAVLCVPRGVPGRWIALLLLLPVLFSARPQPAAGEVWMTLLDVGQGLAAVIRTASHTLVYDAGPAFGEDFDTGRAVIAPYLRYLGVRRIDRLVISHGDNDHIGGARSLLQAFPVDSVLTSVPDAFNGESTQACTRGMHWSWDGIEFALLHPASDDAYTGNNASCVLQIRMADGQSLLLPGDIEEEGERALLRRAGDDLASTVLVVPHHGSRTSSTAAFISAVGPEVALVPAGYQNRYGFPRPEVMARYAARHSQVLETGRSGAITVRLLPHATRPQITRFRRRWPRLWRRPEQDITQFGY